MAQTNNKSKIIEKLKKQGADKALKEHKGDALEVPKGGSIPPGIEFGVAQLIIAQISERKDGPSKGKLYLDLQAIVVDVEDDNPKLKKAIKQRTFNSEDLFDTPQAKVTKTFKQHFAKALNKLRMLGVDTDSIENIPQMMDKLEELQAEKPCFGFRSWIGKATKLYPNPKLKIDWEVKKEDYTPPDESETGVDDNTAEEEPAEDETTDEVDEDTSNEDDTTESSDEAQTEDEVDWDDMASKAADDKAVGKQIEAKAKELGILKEVQDASNWEDAVALIKEKLEGDAPAEDEGADEPAEEEAKPWEPKKGDNYKVKVTGEAKKIDVKVTAVNSKNKTLDCKGIANKKDYKGLKWANAGGNTKINGVDVDV